MKVKVSILNFYSIFITAFILVAITIACNKDDDTVTAASISGLTCASASFSASATIGTAYSGTATIPYTGGNSQTYTAGTAISSTGVTGLTATLSPSTLTSSTGNLSYTITGTPATSGTAAFAVSFGAQSCGLSLTVAAAPVTSATVTGLTCATASFSATATASTAYTATATIPYIGGNSATYAAGSGIASIGVTGLTATLAAGVLANGTGNITYAITGIPSASGTAAFAISFGGQSCSLSLTVQTQSTSTTSAWNVETDINAIVAAAEAFKSTLTSSQVTSLQYTYTKAHAQKWSNFPEAIYKGRVGLQTSSLTTAQWTAFNVLLKAATGTGANEGNEEYQGILDADDYLNKNGGGNDYGSGNYYIAYLGTPSTTALWSLQIGGHHGTIIHTYSSGKMTGGTPSFRSTEPYPTWTSTNTSKTVQPLPQETAAFAAFLSSLSSTELTTAKRSTAQNDLIAGPQKDNNFPTTRTGVKAGNLTTAQKDKLLASIKPWVDDLDDKAAAAILTKYKNELDETYASYYGGTTMEAKGDYILIDGPSVWIEWSMQSGVIIKNGVHPHAVWRDRKADYGAN